MPGIADLIASNLQGDALSRISRSIGAPEDRTRDAALAALPIMLGQMRRNAATPEGAASLAGALERDHDGGLLDNLGPLVAMLGGGAAAGGAGSRALDGAGIWAKARATVIGAVHGLAGTAAVSLLVLSTMPSALGAAIYLGMFALGTLLGMTGLTAVLAWPVGLALRLRRAHQVLALGSGLAAIVFGLPQKAKILSV